MSGTAPPPQQSAVTVNTTQATAATAAGMVGSALVIGAYVLKLRYGIELPGEITAAGAGILTPLLHYAMVRLKVAGA